MLGQLTAEEAQEVQAMTAQHPEIAAELGAIQQAVEHFAQANAVSPPGATKEDLLQRVAEIMPRIPIINEQSKPEDYARWLDHPKHQAPEDYDNRHVSVFGVEENRSFLIAWFRRDEEPHVHRKTTEVALVVEGTCNMIMDGEVTAHKSGDVIVMRPGCVHGLTVTSDIPMKAVIMRVAG